MGVNSHQQRLQQQLNNTDNGQWTVKVLVKTYPKEANLKYQQTASGNRNMQQSLNVMKNLEDKPKFTNH